MFYLTTHSTHFIYGYMASKRETAKDESRFKIGSPLNCRIIVRCANGNREDTRGRPLNGRIIMRCANVTGRTQEGDH